ncbi:11870_t:CDS:2 [Funneliformis mosseae]|uniref:11870_t:CDS:1 n=1 Tax=Funneliformis mosseae TaxID=27381 RepID=A0A9N9F3J6_FUNMO|nr:11870_t:CDS:2 [Funneliformis mosseae]
MFNMVNGQYSLYVSIELHNECNSTDKDISYDITTQKIQDHYN